MEPGGSMLFINVLYSCKSGLLIKRGTQAKRVFENMIMRRIPEPKINKQTKNNIEAPNFQVIKCPGKNLGNRLCDLPLIRGFQND